MGQADLALGGTLDVVALKTLDYRSDLPKNGCQPQLPRPAPEPLTAREAKASGVRGIHPQQKGTLMTQTLEDIRLLQRDIEIGRQFGGLASREIYHVFGVVDSMRA